MKLMEQIGRGVGWALSPLTAAGSFIRRSRLFHPDGVVYRAEVLPAVVAGPAGDVAARLAGPALVRLSSGWWKGGKERPDALGVSIRFRSDTSATPEPAPGDQDLLFASFPSLWLLPIAALMTNQHNFLANDYFAMAPFDIEGLGRVKLRLRARRVPAVGDRQTSLERATAAGIAVFELEARRLGLRSRYERIATIRLLSRAFVDQEALRLSPFRSGRGIVPRGFVQAARIGTYALSQLARPESAVARPESAVARRSPPVR
jgi:hypothetical protein